MPRWDPQQYERFDDHRSRPFFDLLARVGARAPARVLDLGCGNGPLTLAAAQRWPHADVIGVDSSREMLTRAQELDSADRVRWVEADVASRPIDADGLPDVVLSNATLQWVPNHRDLITGWLERMPAGGWFAMQVPGNFDAPSHRIIREVAAQQPDAGRLLEGYRMTSPVGEPDEYAELLARSCDHVDVWETTYCQLLDPAGEQQAPVLEWVKGTALRPLLDRLDDDGRARFLTELQERLAQAYPRRDYGVPFPFRRIFAVGRVAAVATR